MAHPDDAFFEKERIVLTDLSAIAARGVERDLDNWNFLAYLNAHVAAARVDDAVKELHAEVAAAIDCTSCGNCCRVQRPCLSAGDVTMVADGMGLPTATVKKRYLSKVGRDAFLFRAPACPMLAERRCAVHPYRPRDCREYPHLDKDDFLSRAASAIGNYRICPIVFNVYERLKSAFSYDPDCDYAAEAAAHAT